jgi:hypothetical protein
MRKIFIIVFFLFVPCAWAQEEVEFVAESSCSLSVKTTAMPVDSLDKTGSVKIEALVTDKDGKPLEGLDIRMTTTNGALSCMPPVRFAHTELSSGTQGCLKTQEDGTITIYLVNIPFNRPGQVKAFCAYGRFKVSALGSYSIKKSVKTVRTKNAKKQSWLNQG